MIVAKKGSIMKNHPICYSVRPKSYFKIKGRTGSGNANTKKLITQDNIQNENLAF